MGANPHSKSYRQLFKQSIFANPIQYHRRNDQPDNKPFCVKLPLCRHPQPLLMLTSKPNRFKIIPAARYRQGVTNYGNKPELHRHGSRTQHRRRAQNVKAHGLIYDTNHQQHTGDKMAARLTAIGLLVEEPQRKKASNGAYMAVSRMGVYMPCDSSPGGQCTLWVSLVAFDEHADSLASYRKGDVIAVSGGMRRTKRRGKDGKIVKGYQVIADTIEPYRTSAERRVTARA
ncbi:single-stranded DNA-binding protein [Salmonella enterica]|nr:single-stranded DNA-binding protein [Salmonella enterica]